MRWESARPFVTDPIYQANRYWIDQYKQSGLRNRLDDIQITRVEPVKITLDAYFEAITIRIFAQMLDWTEDKQGKVVGGSNKKQRLFSEYWTFIRAVGAPDRPLTSSNCPSCAAPLDQVNESGTCEYCGSRITGGDFNWVLSSIAQDEVYTG